MEYTHTPESVIVNLEPKPPRLDTRTKLLLVALAQCLKTIGGAFSALGKAIDSYCS